MSRDDRIALLLAARLLESRVPYDAPDLRGEGGHLDVAFDLAERLRRVADGDAAAQIAGSLRSAASEIAEV
jgi:hypothetical protein